MDNTPVIQTVGLTKVFRDTMWTLPEALVRWSVSRTLSRVLREGRLRRPVVAVDRLDVDVHQNEVFGLLGPNGSGKTTTIKMLLGLLYPTKGRIRVLGRAPTDVAIKARIGYLPEESYLYRFLNARETLDYYGRLFQIPRQDRRRRVEQLLEMVGLKREARRRVGEYSKGMARRIGLAQALINDPDLLILDEPTTGLDPVGTREMKDLIAFLNREKGKTVLLCSHLLADVEDVCQRVTVLYGGRCQAVGGVHELLAQENLTQITTERLSGDALQRIRRIVEQDEHKAVVSIEAPSDRLETFFLRIVREAQAARQDTSGVTSGGQIADFLAAAEAPQGEAVVESLVAAASRRDTPVTEAPSAPAEAESPAPEVVDQLLSAGTHRAEPAPGVAGADTPASEDDLDRSLIDGLVQQRTDDHDPDVKE